MAEGTLPAALTSLSSELAGVVERAGPSVVRVDDGSRLTATGVIWSQDGVVVTTSHGLERDENLAVELADGTRLAATLAGRDGDTDLALLRVAASSLPAIDRAEPGAVKVGHLVLALARPGAWGLHATIGIVSTRMDTERNGEPGYILHTDAVLYPGFSGGALVDMGGRTVGVTNLMFGRGKGVAIGTPVVRQVAEAILAHGRMRRGFLGVTTHAVALSAGLSGKVSPEQARALVVIQIESASPAEQAGLLIGDILLGIDNRAIEDAEALRRQLRTASPGDTVTLRILRGGELRDLPVTLGEVPS